MFTLLIHLLILIIVLAVVYWIITLFPIPEPFRRIVLAILGLIFLIAFLYMLGPTLGWKWS
jgi:hypothetical protein